jgi:hypothetical protein
MKSACYGDPSNCPLVDCACAPLPLPHRLAESYSPPLAPAADPRTKDTNPKDAIGDKKLPLSLCSPIAKAAWAVAQFVGMVKYGAWNWRSAGIRSSIYTSALQRHLDAYLSGEEVDPIDQTPHLGHIMACAAILIDAKAAGKLNDDRPPVVGLREAYAAAEKQMALARENYGHMRPHHFTIADTGSISAATP